MMPMLSVLMASQLLIQSITWVTVLEILETDLKTKQKISKMQVLLLESSMKKRRILEMLWPCLMMS